MRVWRGFQDVHILYISRSGFSNLVISGGSGFAGDGLKPGEMVKSLSPESHLVYLLSSTHADIAAAVLMQKCLEALFFPTSFIFLIFGKSLWSDREI